MCSTNFLSASPSTNKGSFQILLPTENSITNRIHIKGNSQEKLRSNNISNLNKSRKISVGNCDETL